MTLDEVRAWASGIAASAIVGLVGKWFGIKRAEETRSAVTWALEQGVAYAALRLKNAAGAQKRDAALNVATSIAPKAIGKLREDQKSALVEATYARLKPSLPGSTFSMKGDDIPVDVVDFAESERPKPALSDRPTPLPPLRGPVGPGVKGGPK